MQWRRVEPEIAWPDPDDDDCPFTWVPPPASGRPPSTETITSGRWKWRRGEVFSQVPDDPRARAGHCAVALDDETMWIFGGRGSNGAFFGDCFLLRVPKARGRGPPRGGLGDLGDDSAYSMNDAFRAEPRRKDARADRPSWTPGEQLDAPRPPARTEAAACLCGGAVAIFGGTDASGCLDDLWLYDVAARLWSRPVWKPTAGSDRTDKP